MKWHPSRTAIKAMSGSRTLYYRWQRYQDQSLGLPTFSPDHYYANHSTRTTEIVAERVGSQKIVVAFDDEGQIRNHDEIGRDVESLVDQAKTDIDGILVNSNLVADVDGFNIDVIVRVDGKAWPAVYNVTASERDSKCTCPNDDETRCIHGDVYGPCTSDNCYGVCDLSGYCTCDLHQIAEHEPRELEEAV